MFLRSFNRLRALATLCTALAAAPSPARCVDESTGNALPEAAVPLSDHQADGPRLRLRQAVQAAIYRSNTVGAARLLAEAARSDVGEARASGLPQAALSGGVSFAGTSGEDIVATQGSQGRASLNVSAPLYDAGRVAELTGWRSNLAQAARMGEINAQEEVGLQTVSLTLDRGRYSLQAQVYRQYAEKMGCLVEALQQIVSADRGRASELVQAQKNLQQVELAQEQTAAALRQVETRLRRFIGDDLPDVDGMSTVMLDLPPLDRLQAEAEQAGEIAQLDAQADALASYSRAVVAGQKPQVSWQLSGSRIAGVGNSKTLTAGININIPLYSPADVYTAGAARQRAEAARLQRADALEARKFRMADAHEQAAASFDRARRVIDVVRLSNQVRNATLQQWQQLGRRSLFDVMAAEGDHYGLRVAYVNALFDGEQSVALLHSLGLGLGPWLQ